MDESTVIDTADGPMRAFVARPTAPPDRAAVVLQEAFGVNDHIRDVTRRFAERGFLAIAPDLFYRTGPAVVDYDDRVQALGLIEALGPEQVVADVAAALRHLDEAEGIAAARVAVVGFCFGGRAAFTAATATSGLGAAVVFYGPGVAAGPHQVLDRAATITAPLLLHVGADDPSIPAAHRAATQDALQAADVVFTQHVYPGAGHAFACDARPALYDADAARLAWERTGEFLDEHLPPA